MRCNMQPSGLAPDLAIASIHHAQPLSQSYLVFREPPIEEMAECVNISIRQA